MLRWNKKWCDGLGWVGWGRKWEDIIGSTMMLLQVFCVIEFVMYFVSCGVVRNSSRSGSSSSSSRSTMVASYVLTYRDTPKRVRRRRKKESLRTFDNNYRYYEEGKRYRTSREVTVVRVVIHHRIRTTSENNKNFLWLFYGLSVRMHVLNGTVRSSRIIYR